MTKNTSELRWYPSGSVRLFLFCFSICLLSRSNKWIAQQVKKISIYQIEIVSLEA